MQKIRLTHCISSLKIGGAEEVLCSLIEALPHNIYEQTVVYFHDGPQRARLENAGIPCYHIKGFLTLYDPIAFIRFVRCIQLLKPDILHSALWLANFFARITGTLLHIRTINSLHNTITRDHDGLVRMAMDTISLRLADAIIAVSPSVADSAPTKVQSKITVIPNGVNAQTLIQKNKDSHKTRADIGLSDTHFVFGTVGRFVPVKNYELLIAACVPVFATHAHARLIILGSGPLEHVLRMQAQSLGIADKIIFIINEPAYAYYSLFDCFVQPSKNEGLSIALLEALCFSVPAIVTGTPKHPVIEHMRTGLVVEPAMQALVQALTTYITSPALCERFATASAHITAAYSCTRMAQQYHALFVQK